MAREDGDGRSDPRRPRGIAFVRFVYGAGLVALGACLGIVIGSLSETPRLLLERMRGPVETVEIAAPIPAERESEPAAAKLEAFGDLQEGKAPRSAGPLPASPKPVVESEPPPERVPPSELPTPEPISPPVAAAPPAPAPELPATPRDDETAAVKPAGGAVVQVASYVERKPAEDLVAKLKSTGFQAYVSQPAAANGRYRVRIRPDAGESAGDLAKRLRGFGFDTWATTE